MTELDLFGNPIDAFATALERYGVWPTTVWECDHSDKRARELKLLVGDGGESRSGSGQHAWPDKRQSARYECFTKQSDDRSVYRGKTTESIFNPAVAIWLCNMYAPDTGLVFDPFAGGGTRAIVVAKRGLAYLGVELRQEEVEAVRARAERNYVSDYIHIDKGDARDCSQIASTASADFLITCPPYYNLEQYKGGLGDLSMCDTYAEFLTGIRLVVRECYRILKPGANACWVIGLHRDKEQNLLCLHHDITCIHRECGFKIREEIILEQVNTGAIQRVGQFEKGNRLLVRTHEYAMVYVR